jgi:hypothetical protein
MTGLRQSGVHPYYPSLTGSLVDALLPFYPPSILSIASGWPVVSILVAIRLLFARPDSR